MSGNDTVQPGQGSALQHRIYRIAVGVLLAAAAYLFLSSKASETINKIQGVSVFLLGVWPGLLWLKTAEKRLPLVEVLMMTLVTSYALPILNGHEERAGYSSAVITTAASAVIAFQLSVLFAYSRATALPKRTSFWTQEIIKREIVRYMSYGVVLNTVYLIASNYTTLLPPNFDGVIRAVCGGIANVCTFVAFQMWGSDELPRSERAFIVVNLLLQAILSTETLFLIGFISLCALATLGYVTSKKSLPVIPVAIAVVLAALLHNGEPAMRAKYWFDDGTRLLPPVSELPSFYSDWLANGLNPQNDSDAEDKGAAANLIQRTSLFQMVCLVASNSPDRVPYVSGATYADIPVQLVPRPLWPNKPSGQWSTNYLSVYYGLQSEEGTANTTIAFGQIAEAYANFGFFAVVIMGLCTGLFYKIVQCWTKNTPLLSGAGLLVVVLMGWTFQTEYTLSTWISSLYQASVSILVVVTGIKLFFF